MAVEGSEQVGEFCGLLSHSSCCHFIKKKSGREGGELAAAIFCSVSGTEVEGM